VRLAETPIAANLPGLTLFRRTDRAISTGLAPAVGRATITREVVAVVTLFAGPIDLAVSAERIAGKHQTAGHPL
jgi:hypothetical protein